MELALVLEAELVLESELVLEAELVLESELVLALRTLCNNRFQYTPSPERRMWLCNSGIGPRSFCSCIHNRIALFLEHMSSYLEREKGEHSHCSLHRQNYRVQVMRQRHDLVFRLHVRHNHVCPLTGAPARWNLRRHGPPWQAWRKGRRKRSYGAWAPCLLGKTNMKLMSATTAAAHSKGRLCM